MPGGSKSDARVGRTERKRLRDIRTTAEFESVAYVTSAVKPAGKPLTYGNKSRVVYEAPLMSLYLLLCR